MNNKKIISAAIALSALVGLTLGGCGSQKLPIKIAIQLLSQLLLHHIQKY